MITVFQRGCRPQQGLEARKTGARGDLRAILILIGTLNAQRFGSPLETPGNANIQLLDSCAHLQMSSLSLDDNLRRMGPVHVSGPRRDGTVDSNSAAERARSWKSPSSQLQGARVQSLAVSASDRLWWLKASVSASHLDPIVDP
jgi:hypothetical protein